MTSREPSNPVVHRLVAAINDSYRDALLTTLTPDATLTDDGNLSLRADIPACDNAILKVKCRPSSHWPGRSELATNRLRVRAPRSGRSVSRRLLPDP